MCHQNPKVMENPPAPSNKLSPIVISKGIQGIKWAIGIFHLMPESGLSVLQKNSILSRMVLEACRARSLQGVTKALVCIARTTSQNSADDSVRSLLFSDNAYAIYKYKCKGRWITQLAPLVRRASFPVSFWASDTLK
jgi:hypothetical protein